MPRFKLRRSSRSFRSTGRQTLTRGSLNVKRRQSEDLSALKLTLKRNANRWPCWRYRGISTAGDWALHLRRQLRIHPQRTIITLGWRGCHLLMLPRTSYLATQCMWLVFRARLTKQVQLKGQGPLPEILWMQPLPTTPFTLPLTIILTQTKLFLSKMTRIERATIIRKSRGESWPRNQRAIITIMKTSPLIGEVAVRNPHEASNI